MVGPRASVERLLSTKDDMLLSVAIVAGAYGAAFTAKATTGSKVWDTLYDNECSNHIVRTKCAWCTTYGPVRPRKWCLVAARPTTPSDNKKSGSHEDHQEPSRRNR